MGTPSKKLVWKQAQEKLSGRVARVGEVIHLPKISAYRDDLYRYGRGRYGQLAPPRPAPLSNSFLKFPNQKLIKLSNRKPSAKGAYGEVRFGESVAGSKYAVKILKDATQYYKDKEGEIGKDVGLILQQGKAALGVKKVHYLMPMLGHSMRTHLSTYRSTDEKYDLAIKLCHQVALHHLGMATESNKQVTHRDIKPDNVMVKGKDVYLVDYGLAEYGDLSRKATEHVGTPYYLPYYSATTYTLEELDSLALKRTVFMPGSLHIYLYGKKIVPASVSGILDRQFKIDHHLMPYFDTSSMRPAHHKPLLLGALLILGRYNKQQHAKVVEGSDSLQKALYVLYMGNRANEKNIGIIMESTSLRANLVTLWPIAGKVDSRFLRAAIVNKGLFSTLGQFAHLPNKLLQQKVDIINSADLEAILSEDISALNLLKYKLGQAPIVPPAPVHLPKLVEKAPVAQPSPPKKGVIEPVQKDITPEAIHGELKTLVKNTFYKFNLKSEQAKASDGRFVTSNAFFYKNHAKEYEKSQLERFVRDVSKSINLKDALRIIQFRLDATYFRHTTAFNEQLQLGLQQLILKHDSEAFKKQVLSRPESVIAWIKQYAIADRDEKPKPKLPAIHRGWR